MHRSRIVSMLILLLVLIAFAPVAASQTTIRIDPKATYLLTNDDPEALNAVPIDLGALGVKPGDVINLWTVGDMSWCWKWGCPENSWTNTACGVFSTSANLLPANVLNRVPGAKAFAGVANACEAGPTLSGGVPRDIPQDFWLDGSNVRVPQGAKYLFAAVPDSFMGDNGDPDGDYAIVIQKALTPIPLQVLMRVVPWENNRMTSTARSEEMQLFPSEGEMYYVSADPNEFGTIALNRFSNNTDHMDSTATYVEGYELEGPLGFGWTSRSLPGLSPMVEGFNVATSDHALMWPGEHLDGYETYGLNIFGYKRFGWVPESFLTLSKGGVTVSSNLVFGGLVNKWSWNGKQFMLPAGPGSGMTILLFHDFGLMRENTDNYGHGSPIATAMNNDSVQITRAVPMEADPDHLGGSYGIPLLYRDVILGKDLALNFNGLGPVARYQTHVTLPRKLTSSLYMPIIEVTPELNRLWKYDAEIDTRTEVTNQTYPANSECESFFGFEPQFNGVILSTTDRKYAIGIYAANVAQGGSVTWLSVSKHFCGDATTDHTRMDAIRNSELAAGESTHNAYIVTGTLADVETSMRKLYLAGAK